MTGRRTARALPLLVAAALSGLAGCTSSAPFAGGDEPSRTGSSGVSASSAQASAVARVPAAVDLAKVAVGPWRVRQIDPLPQIKLTAARTVAYLLGWPDGGAGLEVARARAKAIDLNPALVDPLAPWVESPDGTGRRALIDAAQYVGLEPQKKQASVVVLVRQVGRRESTAYSRLGTSITVRVELVQQGPRWVVSGLLATDGACPADVPPPTYPPGSPEATARRALPPEEAARATQLARALADEPRLGLPAAARNDLLCERIDPLLLDLLDRLSHDFRLGVSVLRSGHPAVVYGTDKVSHHQQGRAVDVWAVNGLSVTNPDAADDVRALAREAHRLGANEVGAPLDVDGPTKPEGFTNELHHDHLHLAIELPEDHALEQPGAGG